MANLASVLGSCDKGALAPGLDPDAEAPAPGRRATKYHRGPSVS